MPVELEFKYVLKGADGLWDQLAQRAAAGEIQRADIRQGYLSRGGRIRSRDWIHLGGGDPLPTEFIFTYKHDLKSQPGCLELEVPMTREDFDLAWSDSDHNLSKTRFLLPCPFQVGVWEVDFFQDDQGIYLALAEFEVPARSGPPDRLHPLVEQHLFYSVPQDDGRFKNRKLCSRARVEEILKEIV